MANVVGYKNPASSKANNNFYRERVYTVSNPKTQAQAMQRAKVRPAQIFYTGFEKVLNHAFLPSLRASRNRNRFMSLAMRLDEIPDVMKGEAFLPFCQYQISAGALGLDQVCLAQKFDAQPASTAFEWQQSIYFPNLRADDSIEFDESETIGAVSEVLIANTPGLVAGMELTFLAVAAPSDNPYSRIAHIISFVLDPGNTVTTLGDVCGDQIRFRRFGNDSVVITSDNFDYMILSAGLIISARAGNTYVYTNSRMCHSYIVENSYNDYESEVIASYMEGGSSRGSELILQQASNKAPGNRVVPSSVAQTGITLAEGVSGTLSSVNAGIVTMTNGDKRILVANALGQICDYDAAAGAAVPVTITPAGGAARPLTLADTTFAGNGTITIADLQAAGIEVGHVSNDLAVVTEMFIEDDTYEQGAFISDVTAGSEVYVEGSNLSNQNVKLVNMNTGNDITPSVDSDTMQKWLVPNEGSILCIVINGDTWATFHVDYSG